MQITDIKIRKIFDDGPMKAVVSVTFDGQLAVHDIKVINARDKFFIVMPSRANPDGTYRDIVHPINADFRKLLKINPKIPCLKRFNLHNDFKIFSYQISYQNFLYQNSLRGCLKCKFATAPFIFNK